MQSDNTPGRALRMLARKHGATIDDLVRKLPFETEKQARGLLDRLRAKGHRIENVGPRRFRAPAA